MAARRLVNHRPAIEATAVCGDHGRRKIHKINGPPGERRAGGIAVPLGERGWGVLMRTADVRLPPAIFQAAFASARSTGLRFLCICADACASKTTARVGFSPPWNRAADARTGPPSGLASERERSTALHRSEELVVGLGVLHLVEQEFDRSELVHRMQQLAQDPDLLQLVRLDQQLFAARAGAVDVDRRDTRASRRCGDPGALPCCRCP